MSYINITEGNNISFKLFTAAAFNACTTGADGWEWAQCYTTPEHLNQLSIKPRDWGVQIAHKHCLEYQRINVHTEDSRGILVWKCWWTGRLFDWMHENYLKCTNGWTGEW